jgi:ATP-binding cassette subfamily B protein
VTSRPTERFALPRPLGGPRARMLVGLVLIGLAQAVGVIGFSLTLHVLIDHLHRSSRQAGIYAPWGGWPLPVLITVLTATAAIAVVFRGLGVPLAERLAQSYVHSVRVRLFDQVANSVTFSPRRRTVGVTVLRFTGDSSALRMWASRGVAAMVVEGVFVCCTTAMLTMLLPVAGLAAAGLLGGATLTVVLLGRRLALRVREVRRHNGRLATFVNERVTNTAVIQSLGRVRRERNRLSRRSRRFSSAMIRQAGQLGVLASVAELCRVAVTVAVLAVAVSDGAHADLIASLMVLTGFLGGPLATLVQAQEYRQRSRVARRRITEVLGTPAELAVPDGASALWPGPSRLELRKLGVTGVFGGIDATALPGQRIAVCGAAGSGKSLLLALIARLRLPDVGEVLLDGQNLAESDPDSVGRAVRLVSRELPLLRGSVAMNLRLGEVDPPDVGVAGERVRALSERFDQLLARRLPDGLDTRVGEGGRGLSAGERYRVALARALRGGPRVLLLDDCDADDGALAELFDHYPGTLVYVSAEPDLLARADVRWTLVDGGLLGLPAARPLTV